MRILAFLFALVFSSLAFAYHPSPPPPPPPAPAPVIAPAPDIVIPTPYFLGEPSGKKFTPGWAIRITCGFGGVALAIATGGLTAVFPAVVGSIYTTKAYLNGPDARGDGHDYAQAGFACISLGMAG